MGWISCHVCKERFGLDEPTEASLRRSGHVFCCPWGHRAVFKAGPTEADQLRQERDRLRQNTAYLESQITRQREAREVAERRASAMKGQVTRLKNRAANGVCPCCNRTFANLQRHMATKHAGFVAEEVQVEIGKPLH